MDSGGCLFRAARRLVGREQPMAVFATMDMGIGDDLFLTDQAAFHRVEEQTMADDAGCLAIGSRNLDEFPGVAFGVQAPFQGQAIRFRQAARAFAARLGQGVAVMRLGAGQQPGLFLAAAKTSRKAGTTTLGGRRSCTCTARIAIPSCRRFTCCVHPTGRAPGP